MSGRAVEGRDVNSIREDDDEHSQCFALDLRNQSRGPMAMDQCTETSNNCVSEPPLSQAEMSGSAPFANQLSCLSKQASPMRSEGWNELQPAGEEAAMERRLQRTKVEKPSEPFEFRDTNQYPAQKIISPIDSKQAIVVDKGSLAQGRPGTSDTKTISFPPRESVDKSNRLLHVDVSCKRETIQTQSNEDSESEGASADIGDYSEFSYSDEERPLTVQENQLLYGSTGEYSLYSLEQMENRFEDRDFHGAHQKVVRHSHTRSPFANLGKTSTLKAARATFLPQTIVLETDAKNYPTYLCPICGTRQREFFSVSDAPRQLEGPSGYLALYFSIYVISSLFIFGLEEGWRPLDCIYFAVVTLTTAGLGDFVPTSDVNKIICSIFIYFGVACIGLLLGSYIAGMLDDSASREAKRNQLSSCPNCARIKTLQDATSNTPEHTVPDTTPAIPRRSNRRSCASERILDKAQNQDHSAVYTSHHCHRTHTGQRQSSFESHASPFHDKGVEVTTSSSQGASTVENIASLGSPVTRGILGRQRHTRHDSFDITGNARMYSAAAGMGRTRKFSEDVGVMMIPSIRQAPPTIQEGAQLETPPLGTDANGCMEPPYTRSRGFTSESDSSKEDDMSDSDDDDSFAASTHTSSGSSEAVDDGMFKLQVAKYVFLVLKQALVNSMVIIGVGCLGFRFIEGFSLVDSWYFTTVFLTTVGYGDIVPVTKGGKLFATVYILVAGTILLNNMSLISMIPLELRKRRIERAVLTQFGDQLDDAALRELATGPVIQRLHLSANRPDGLDECTREMFSLAMLVRLGKVSDRDIKQTFAAFQRLDLNDEGVLNSKSIIAAMIQKRRLVKQNQQFLQASHLPYQPPPPPPFVAPPLPQHVQQDPIGSMPLRHNEDMQHLRFGQRGSMHVDTAEGHHYRFQRPEFVPTEQSALLPHYPTHPPQLVHQHQYQSPAFPPTYAMPQSPLYRYAEPHGIVPEFAPRSYQQPHQSRWHDRNRMTHESPF